MTNKNILTKNVRLTRNSDIQYSGGPLNSYDKMGEIVIKSLNGTNGICFVVCAVDRYFVPICIQKINNNIEKQCIFSIKDTMRFAVASSAHGLIIAHNSISAEVYCIQDDIDIIQSIQTRGRLLGIHLIDYIILDDHDMKQNLWFLSENLIGFSGCYGQTSSKIN